MGMLLDMMVTNGYPIFDRLICGAAHIAVPISHTRFTDITSWCESNENDIASGCLTLCFTEFRLGVG